MRILAIETSCDETGVAVVHGEKTENGFWFSTQGSALLSQAGLHAQYGGVYPTLAKREHEKNLPIILAEALAAAGMEHPPKVDAIAVTHGPGLEPALWTGITFAQELSKEWNLPLFGTNHLEGHLISSLARRSADEDEVHISEIEHVQFPILGLVISGGHTEFVLIRDWFQYEKIGETLDDAVGECFDKVARMLELPYPGGPHISKLAAEARNKNFPTPVKLPRPMLHSGNCDVSFSGLKTAALYALRDLGGVEKLSEEQKAAFAREFEDTVADVFIAKTRRALEETGARTFVIGGGVAANTHLRKTLSALIADEFPDVDVRVPDVAITGDNATMIAQAALVHLLEGDWQLDASHVGVELRANGNLSLDNTK